MHGARSPRYRFVQASNAWPSRNGRSSPRAAAGQLGIVLLRDPRWALT